MTNPELFRRKLSRREFLKLSGFAGASFVLGGCSGVMQSPVEKGPQTSPTAAGSPEAGESPKTIATATPRVLPETSVNYTIRGELFAIAGVPPSVDLRNVDVAQGEFINTIGNGTEAFIAERGKLLVGPDFPQSVIDKSGGAIERINETNQKVFECPEPSYFNLPEGGFVLATGNVMRVKIGDAIVNLEGAPGHNWILVVRGLFSDGKPDSDRNIQMEFSDYIPGHIQVMRYPGRPNGGFISEGQFKQIAQTSHTEGTNCGADGCTGLSVFMYDANTGAAAVIRQTGVNGPWQSVWANFPTRN